LGLSARVRTSALSSDPAGENQKQHAEANVSQQGSHFLTLSTLSRHTQA